MKKCLLIISCSNKKSKADGLLPAIERYTGAWYEVIKKLRREKRLPVNLDIVIISAKYGFLKSNEPIEYYDLIMTKERAEELNPKILSSFESLLSNIDYEAVFINLGNDYMPSITGLESIISHDTKLYYAKGRVGERKKRMKEWILSLRA